MPKYLSEDYPKLIVFAADGTTKAQFEDGKLETDDKGIMAALENTPGVRKVGKDETPPAPTFEETIAKLQRDYKLEELVGLAKDRKLDVDAGATKAQLARAIAEHDGGAKEAV